MAAPIGGPTGPAILLATCSIPSLKAAWSGLDISVINAYVAVTQIPIPPKQKGYFYNELSTTNYILENYNFKPNHYFELSFTYQQGKRKWTKE